MSDPLGIGILGLHEGRTLFIALNHRAPAAAGGGADKTLRAANVKAVAGCDLLEEKIFDARRECPDPFYTLFSL